MDNTMPSSFVEKQNTIKDLFTKCKTSEEKYKKIIELGKDLPAFSDEHKKETNLVAGCQSVTYLYTFLQGDKIYFEADSDALISQGLAALLTLVYSGESPELVITLAPDYLEELQIPSALTPNRANGLYSIHLRMKQEALKCLV